MPFDNEPSRWADHLARLKIIRRKARNEKCRARRFNSARLVNAEWALRNVTEEADVIGEVDGAVFLLVRLSAEGFQHLCVVGAELEDLEENGDAELTEADEGEADLGRTERIQQPKELGTDDAEPSLGSTGMTNQRRWSEGECGDDHELDGADAEPSLGSPEPSLIGITREPAWPHTAVIGDTVRLVIDQSRWARGGNDDREVGEP